MRAWAIDNCEVILSDCISDNNRCETASQVQNEPYLKCLESENWNFEADFLAPATLFFQMPHRHEHYTGTWNLKCYKCS